MLRNPSKYEPRQDDLESVTVRTYSDRSERFVFWWWVSMALLMVTALILGSVNVFGALDTGITSYWTWDEGTGTTVGDNLSNNSGTVSASVWSATAKLGPYSSYTDALYPTNYGTTSSLSVGGDITIAGWVRYDSVTGYQVIMADWSAAQRNYYFYTNAGTLEAQTGNGGGSSIAAAITGGSMVSGSWYHVAMVRDGSTLKMYLNGTETASGSIGAFTGGTTTQEVRIGSVSSGGSNFNGYLDEFGFWGRALNASEISELYNSGDGLAYPFSPPTPGNTTYVSLTAVDAYDGSSITTFSANVSNSTDTFSYSTTNGTIITGINDSTSSLFNITFTAYDYISNTSLNVDVSSGSYEGSMAQAFVSFTCSEIYTNASLTCDESGPFPRKAGSYTNQINVTGYHSISFSYNVTALGGSGDYRTYEAEADSFTYDGSWTNPEYGNDGNFDSEPTVVAGSGVSNMYWNFTTALDDLTVGIEGDTDESYTIPSACLPNPELRYYVNRPSGVGFAAHELSCWDGASWILMHNWGEVTPGVTELAIGALESEYKIQSYDVEGFFDYNLTVSANDYAGNPELNFTLNLTNSTLGIDFYNTTTSGSLTYPLLSGYNYSLTLNATSTIYGDPVNQIGYANISIVGTPPASESYQFNLSAARPVFVTLYYEENLTLFENPANLSLIPLSDSSEVFISTSTSNGTTNFYNIPVAEYRLRVSSPGYHDEDRYFILSTYTGQNLTAYFRENTTGTAKEFNVVDERNILQNGWIIRFQRYYNDTGWITVDEARSNIDGLAIENVLSDEYYRLILLNEGLVEEYRSERTLLLQDTYQISSNVDTITNTQINTVLGVSAIVYMHPNLDRVEAIGTSSSGTRDWKLELYRTYTDGPVLVNSTTASGDSVNLSLYLPNATGDYYSVLSVLGSEVPVASNNLFIGGGPAAIGVSGAFYSFVLLLGIVGLAVFSAPAAIVLAIFAVIIASITGLFYVGLNAIVGLAIVGGMIIFRRNT